MYVLFIFYNLYACALLHGNMPLAENQMLVICVNPPYTSQFLIFLDHLQLTCYQTEYTCGCAVSSVSV